MFYLFFPILSSFCWSTLCLSSRKRFFPKLVGREVDRGTSGFRTKDFGAKQIIGASTEHNTFHYFNFMDASFRQTVIVIQRDRVFDGGHVKPESVEKSVQFRRGQLFRFADPCFQLLRFLEKKRFLKTFYTFEKF